MKYKNKGISLIETLIYVAIFSMFIISINIFMKDLRVSKLRNQIILEVNYQGNRVADYISSSVRNSNSIISPTIAQSSSEIQLSKSDTNLDPTIFFVATGTLYIKEGNSAPIALTNNRVSIENFSVVNMSRIGTQGNVKIRFTAKNNSDYIRTEEQYSKDFYIGASIR